MRARNSTFPAALALLAIGAGALWYYRRTAAAATPAATPILPTPTDDGGVEPDLIPAGFMASAVGVGITIDDRPLPLIEPRALQVSERFPTEPGANAWLYAEQQYYDTLNGLTPASSTLKSAGLFV